MNTNFDVVVVGGGFAGLVAAREAGNLGQTVLLVEALDRLGGRTWTTEGLGTSVEMGGTDIHWLQPNAWAEAARYGLEIEEFAPPEQLLYFDGSEVKEGTEAEVFGLLDKGMTALAEVAREAYPRPQDPEFSPSAFDYDKLSLGEFLDGVEMTVAERAMMSSFWSSGCQGPVDEAGLTFALRWLALAGWDWALMVDVIARYKITGGMKRLSDGIASDIRGEIRTGVAATAIVDEGDEVAVTLSDGSVVRARAVVVAVPINVLSRITFEPARPEFEEIANAGMISGGLKVVCRIRGDRTPYMAFAPEGNPLVIVQYDRSIDGDHIAVGFGPDATALDATSVEAVQDVLRGWLPDVEVIEVANHNWTTDEMFLGTWAVPAPGQLRAQIDAVTSRNGRVMLAGADLALGSYALIDGAINTGIRAGRDAARLAAGA